MSNRIETKRLILRTVDDNDLLVINKLINNTKIASVTKSIPYPASIEDTKMWHEKQKTDCKNGKAAVFAIVLKENSILIGVIGLQINLQYENAELGYWIGEPYWGLGFATEAAKAAIDFGFKELNLNRIFAYHMKGNESSGKVLQKTGMQYEGNLKEQIKKNGVFKDIICYGILRRIRDSKI